MIKRPFVEQVPNSPTPHLLSFARLLFLLGLIDFQKHTSLSIHAYALGIGIKYKKI